MEKPRFTLGNLAEKLKAKSVGDPDYEILGLATLASAEAGQLSFLANAKYRKDLESTRAGAVILAPDMVDACPCFCLVSDNPYLTYARASQLFMPRLIAGAGVHPSAVVAESATIGPGASIGAHSVIAEGVHIGANTVIGPNCSIGQETHIGADCTLYANVAIYHDVTLGDRVTIQAGVVIGGDGFGYAPSPDRDTGGWVKIAQLGGVRIGDDVEIGAGSTIDRGALDDTVIGNRVIIDNQVQVAHNVEIGDNTGIAGCAAFAGSCKIGSNCTIAGGVGVVGHVTIADGVHISAMSMVTRSIDQPGSYSSGTPMMESRAWRRSAVRFSQLDALVRRISELERNR